MGTEIERRFLVKDGFNPQLIAHDFFDIEQNYLSDTGSWTVRLRKVDNVSYDNPRYFVTMKKFVSAATNHEIEFEVSEDDYNDMFPHTKAVLRKRRWYIEHDGVVWEVDVYVNAPPEFQTICEVELPSKDTPLDIPDWVGMEVTGDRSFSNAALAERLNP